MANQPLRSTKFAFSLLPAFFSQKMPPSSSEEGSDSREFLYKFSGRLIVAPTLCFAELYVNNFIIFRYLPFQRRGAYYAPARFYVNFKTGRETRPLRWFNRCNITFAPQARNSALCFLPFALKNGRSRAPALRGISWYRRGNSRIARSEFNIKSFSVDS